MAKTLALFNEIPWLELRSVVAQLSGAHASEIRNLLNQLESGQNSPVRIPPHYYGFRDHFNRQISGLNVRLLRCPSRTTALYRGSVWVPAKAAVTASATILNSKSVLRYAQLMGRTDD